MSKIIRFLVFFASVAFVAQSAQASLVSYLDVISSNTIGTGTLATVTLEQESKDEVDVNVVLAKNTKFVLTGGPHNAFVYSLNLSTPYSVTILSPSSGFTLSPSDPSNTPYGSFTNGIDCPGCGPGSSNAMAGPLLFKITDSSGISLSDFVKNKSGYLFSADVLGPNGGTGNIASVSFVGPVPIPGALLMFVTGVIALFAVAITHRASALAVA